MDLHQDSNGSADSQSDGLINGNGTCLPAAKVPELTKLNSLEVNNLLLFFFPFH